MGDGQARGPTAQRLDDREALFQRRAEVLPSGHRVRHIQIVRPDAVPQQLLHQLLHGLRVVVDTLQQHGLRTEGATGAGELGEGFFGGGVELGRVVEVDVDEDRVVPGDHPTEVVGDSLRQVMRDTGVDADDLDMRDIAQVLEEVLETPVRQHQGVAAGEYDVADLGVLAQVLERRVELVERDLLRISDLAAARAKPTVGRADGADQEEDAVGIPVCDVRDRRIRIFAERVNDPVDDLVLVRRRDVLVPKGVAGLLDRSESRGCDSEVELVDRLLYRYAIDVLLAEGLNELVDRGQALLEYLLPLPHTHLAPT